MKCAQHIIESDSACPVCENMVTKRCVLEQMYKKYSSYILTPKVTERHYVV